jgi:hypothetical protein
VLGGEEDNDDDNYDNSSRRLSRRLNEEGFSSVYVGFKCTAI